MTDQNTIRYRNEYGEFLEFDISAVACEPFGFFYGSRVDTPDGPATVIGVRDGFMWFHIDSKDGATHFNCKSYEELLGFGIMMREEDGKNIALSEIAEPDHRKGEYRIKKIEFNGKMLNIVMQNENGPCPLIAIVNVLILRESIKIEDRNDFITSVDELIEKIKTYLIKQHENADPSTKERLNNLMKSMPKLQYGLDVNFDFVRCDSFEMTENVEILKFLNIRMVHGWLVDPAQDEKIYNILKNRTYNDLMVDLVSSQDSQGSSSISREEAESVKQFLDRTSHQLTEYGIKVLQQNISHGELVVFFRNNHFLTLTKYQNSLFTLVTDVGYARERLIVWDTLENVGGESRFHSSAFQSIEEVKRQEAFETAKLFGFPTEKIEEALFIVSDLNSQWKVDDVLAYLSQQND